MTRESAPTKGASADGLGGHRSDSDSTAKHRAFVKVDNVALFDLGGKHHLRMADRLTLCVLVLRADFRTREWWGTVTDLAKDVGGSRNTVDRVLPRLIDRGLIEIVRPFVQGGEGCVRVSAYDHLVVPERGRSSTSIAQNGATSGANARATFAQASRIERAPIVQNSASAVGVTSTNRGREVVRHRGREIATTTPSTRAVALLERDLSAAEVCVNCGEVADGERGMNGAPHCKLCERF